IGTDERYPLITSPRDLLVGDVVCFDTVQDRDPSDHMGFYIGGNRFVDASSTGEVKISPLEDYYLERFTGARRYAQVYYYLPTGQQISDWLDQTGIPERLKPVRDWIDSLRLGERLQPVRDWFDALDIPGRLRPVRDWFDGLDIPGRANRLWDRARNLWHSVTGQN
ncbi:MAG: C40 family peptidase, partial [Clostridia bacterium]|nr:C40 family peptidase [Clostridia bacterium]